MNDASEFMSRVMSNLDGEKDAEIKRLRDALAPFAADKMPSARRTEIAFDRHGLRRCISPLELARDAAYRVLLHNRVGVAK